MKSHDTAPCPILYLFLLDIYSPLVVLPGSHVALTESGLIGSNVTHPHIYTHGIYKVPICSSGFRSHLGLGLSHEPGIKPPILRLVDDLLYPLNHSPVQQLQKYNSVLTGKSGIMVTLWWREEKQAGGSTWKTSARWIYSCINALLKPLTSTGNQTSNPDTLFK